MRETLCTLSHDVCLGTSPVVELTLIMVIRVAASLVITMIRQQEYATCMPNPGKTKSLFSLLNLGVSSL